MPRTTPEKLQIKPNSEVVLGPSTPGQRAMLDPMPEGVSIVEGITRDTAGVVVMFAEDRDELETLLKDALSLLTAPKAVWIGYPKGNKSDINRDSIWQRAEELGWTLNGNISLSNTWSAVRLKPAK